MSQVKEPKYKLSTMRLLWGAFAIINAVKVPFHLDPSQRSLLILHILITLLAAWLAINPPARIRKYFIQ